MRGVQANAASIQNEAVFSLGHKMLISVAGKLVMMLTQKSESHRIISTVI